MKINFKTVVAGLCLASFLNLPVSAQEWQMKQAPIMSPWSENIDPDNLFNEYPRPQKVRESWMNLNGVWDFTKKNTSDIGMYNAAEVYDQKILVPFPIESAISGIMDNDYNNLEKSYVYKRTFTLPSAMSGKNILLNFGGVEWRCVVFVNGQEVGDHEGGFDPFSFDITSALKASGEQEVVVQIYDPTEGGQPRGKQVNNPDGIWYTPSSGIWQTVWLEPVSATRIEDFTIKPDVDNSLVKITIDAVNATADTRIDITVLDKGNQVASLRNVQVGTEVSLPIANAKHWSPDSPFLYDLKFEVKNGTTSVDEVKSYFGMRKIHLGKLRGKPYMFLNNEPIFQYGPLDQGFWPDGLYTAPSYEALRFDLEKTKELGFNMTRKHIKVEPARWYFYCDSIGLMVWQDMVNPTNEHPADSKLGDTEWIKQNFYRETENVVNSLKNHPSIVVWVPYNENWGQFWQDATHTRNGVDLIRRLDDTRLINPASGWTNYELGDIIDRHNYTTPALHDNPFNHRASVCGETGGYSVVFEGHIWDANNPIYNTLKDSEELSQKLAELNSIALNLSLDGISGVVYTQITDVEEELNGFYTYDRKVSKLNEEQKALFRAGAIKLQTKALDYILPTALHSETNLWKYIPVDDAPEGWNTDINMDDSDWLEGIAGFGAGDPPNTKIRTDWNTPIIFLRKKIFIDEMTAEELNALKLSIYHDEDFEVYINGVLAASGEKWISNYSTFDISAEAKAAIKPGEENLFAIKCLQTGGGQYIDMGIVTEIALDKENEEPSPKTFTDINTVEQFNDIRNNLDGFYRLTADVDLSEFDNFEPIGTTSAPFRGYFNGNGHIIKNLKIDRLDDNLGGSSYQGLFGYADGAYFTDLEVLDAQVEGRSDVGALLGKGKGTTIERVVVTNPQVTGVDHIGGITGGNDNGLQASYIRNCYVVNGNINTQKFQVGGIVGVAKDILIEKVYFTGTITAPTEEQGNNAGGIIGLNENERVMMKNTASLATSITGGSASQFVPRGSALVICENAFARNDMSLSDYATDDYGLGRATDEQKKTLEDFKSRSLYESVMGWDFENVWAMAENGFPVFKYKVEVGINETQVKPSTNIKVHSTGGVLSFEAVNPSAVWLYNAAGSLVKRFNINGNTVSIELPQGVYIIKSVSGGNTESLKALNK